MFFLNFIIISKSDYILKIIYFDLGSLSTDFKGLLFLFNLYLFIKSKYIIFGNE